MGHLGRGRRVPRGNRHRGRVAFASSALARDPRRTAPRVGRTPFRRLRRYRRRRCARRSTPDRARSICSSRKPTRARVRTAKRPRRVVVLPASRAFESRRRPPRSRARASRRDRIVAIGPALRLPRARARPGSGKKGRRGRRFRSARSRARCVHVRSTRRSHRRRAREGVARARPPAGSARDSRPRHPPPDRRRRASAIAGATLRRRARNGRRRTGFWCGIHPAGTAARIPGSGGLCVTGDARRFDGGCVDTTSVRVCRSFHDPRATR